jgi:hypothetical protein
MGTTHPNQVASLPNHLNSSSARTHTRPNTTTNPPPPTMSMCRRVSMSLTQARPLLSRVCRCSSCCHSESCARCGQPATQTRFCLPSTQQRTCWWHIAFCFSQRKRSPHFTANSSKSSTLSQRSRPLPPTATPPVSIGAKFPLQTV